jgi:hypothetical protein
MTTSVQVRRREQEDSLRRFLDGQVDRLPEPPSGGTVVKLRPRVERAAS